MVTYEQLWAADPTAWRRAASAWATALGLIERRRTEVSDAAVRLRQSWSAPAQEAAHGRLTQVYALLDAARPAFLELDQVLAEHACGLARAKAMLSATVARAASIGVLIDRDGVTSTQPSGRPGTDSAGTRAAAEIATDIHAALAAAETTDRQTAHRLALLTAEAHAGWPMQPPPAGRPCVGTDPAQVRRWWDGLAPAQRRWLVVHEPGLVGRLDGVPAAARDQANRLLLEVRREALLQRRAQLIAAGAGPSDDALAHVDATLAGLSALTSRLSVGSGPRCYLLGLDTAGDGRVIVAVGNPDRADNVLTYVPGMTSELANAAGELQRAYRMVGRCAELDPAELTSAVLWLDYDAPDSVDEALHTSYADQAGTALHTFQEGLRTTHDGPTAHQTVLGHSYGSLVVGTAARDHGLAADSLIFVGSPGVGVEHAQDLGLPAGQVWSSTARDDVIQYAAPAPSEVLQRVAAAVILPGISIPFVSGPAEDLWFGHNPSDSEFGARVFQADPGGHSGYWDTDNQALDAMARITLGGTYQAAVR